MNTKADIKSWGTSEAPQRSPITAERLQRLRDKLLDLSTNNRMLSFRHPRASCLRVVDELPGILFDYLLQGDQLTFEPVQEPSQRELENWHEQRNQVPRANEARELRRPDAATWARHLGFDVDYDLPVETDSFERPDRHADKKIQTLHYSDDLDARLRKIRAAGRTAIEESGANMLYIAFGFLEWRDQATSKVHQAPLLLLPVELQREQTRGGRYRTKVRWTNEELQPNLSLRKKLEEFNIKLPELEEDQKLESYFTEVMHAVRHKPDWLVRRYVTLGLFEFGKILLYLDLDPERWPSHTPIDGHPLVRAILEGEAGEYDNDGPGTAFAGEIDHSPEAAKSRDLTLELVDRADSSQCEALEKALAGDNLVVEGPPGTGKSQTITNLVAAALARGRTVLFVAEKLAALEVVRRRMRELGLGDFCLELHSHKTRKTEVLEDIADRLRAASHIRPPRDLELAQSRLAERRQKLSEYIDIISRPAGSFRDLTVADALMHAGRARRKLETGVKALEAARLQLESATPLDWGQLADAKRRLRHFAEAFEGLGIDGTAHEHPWAGVSAAHVLPQDGDKIARLAEAWAEAAEELDAALQRANLPQLPPADLVKSPEPFEKLNSFRPLAREADEMAVWIEQVLGTSIPRTTKGANDALTIIRLAAAAPLESLKVRTAFILSRGSGDWLRRHHRRVSDLKESRQRLLDVFRTDSLLSNADDLEEWSAALAQIGFFARFGKRWRSASQAWTGLARPGHLKISHKEKAEHLTHLRQLVIDEQALASDREVAEHLGSQVDDQTSVLEAAIAVADWAENVRTSLPASLADPLMRCSQKGLEELGRAEGAPQSSALVALAATTLDTAKPTFWASLATSFVSDPVRKLVIMSATEDEWLNLMQGVDACAQSARSLLEREQAFVSATGLDQGLWIGEAQNPTLSTLAGRARLAAASREQLPRWLDFDRCRGASEGEPEEALIEAAAEGLIQVELLSLSLDFLIFDGLARQAFRESPALLRISGKSLEDIREEYRAIDAQVMELRRAAIAADLLKRKAPAGRQTGLKSQLTDMALLQAELGKQRRHIPIRQLVKRAGKALQALKPCFMMGPLSVAQYIEPGTLTFDLIIMDEASQMRPEDAIGALARGGQAIVVGDPKQLPPTSFFDRIAEGVGDDGDDAEVTLAEESKSILELTTSIFDRRMLRWHYRSRHEALIAFSNRQFYGDDLIVFPSPAGRGERYGLGWTFIPDGITTKGVNPAEARTVAEAAARFLIEHRNRSLGVVAMNTKQAQRISDELAAMANTDPILAKALAEAENEAAGEPFFIKNLENVQGDERDVIMISMTYGPSTVGGRTPQNFGPINQETGWRRLNVLFTRAKERMEIFSSMRSTDVVPKEGSDRGPRALKLFLDYAETGRLGVEPRDTGNDTDSDFEDAVLEGLRELNFDCVPQVGVASFRLDIGVRDPSLPGEFIAAVECDGAAYHSTPSARDRDRLRQEILENLGWNIIRVWSTDWFRDPSGELERVSGELKRLIAARKEQRARITEKAKPRPMVTSEAPKDVPEPAATDRRDLFDLDTQQHSSVRQRISSGISVEQARANLIDMRERAIRTKFPDADPTKGFLRKSMLDELLKKRPTDMDEFRSMIRLDLRQNTDGAQVAEFGEKVFDILAKVDS